jgi:hypothetical protein
MSCVKSARCILQKKLDNNRIIENFVLDLEISFYFQIRVDNLAKMTEMERFIGYLEGSPAIHSQRALSPPGCESGLKLNWYQNIRPQQMMESEICNKKMITYCSC